MSWLLLSGGAACVRPSPSSLGSSIPGSAPLRWIPPHAPHRGRGIDSYRIGRTFPRFKKNMHKPNSLYQRPSVLWLYVLLAQSVLTYSAGSRANKSTLIGPIEHT